MNNKIILDLDGRFKKCCIFDNKSYVLLGHDNKKTIKGNTLNSRANEQFILDFVSVCVDHMLNKENYKIKQEYDILRDRIENKMVGLQEIKKRQTLNQSIEEYRNKIASGQSRIAQYEAALSADKNYIKGDVIETWVEEPEPVLKEYKTKPDEWKIPKLSAYEVIRHTKNWNGNIYREHYLGRLEKAAKKFMVVLGLDNFKEMFPELSITKADQKKFIGIFGLEKFNTYYPEFKWTKTYYDELSPEDQILFQQWVYEEKLNEEFKEIYSNV